MCLEGQGFVSVLALSPVSRMDTITVIETNLTYPASDAVGFAYSRIPETFDHSSKDSSFYLVFVSSSSSRVYVYECVSLCAPRVANTHCPAT
jgi:hypothetical protein